MAVAAAAVARWDDGRSAYLAVRVEGDYANPFGVASAVEYVGSTPLADAAGNPKPASRVWEELVAACGARRDAQKGGSTPLLVPAPAG